MKSKIAILNALKLTTDINLEMINPEYTRTSASEDVWKLKITHEVIKSNHSKPAVSSLTCFFTRPSILQPRCSFILLRSSCQSAAWVQCRHRFHPCCSGPVPTVSDVWMDSSTATCGNHAPQLYCSGAGKFMWLIFSTCAILSSIKIHFF